jgi:hypothetical protein
LYFKNKWYDFIIKNVSEATSGKTISHTATDVHINELSKNGFALTLETELENNRGTAEKLATDIFSDTDWNVTSESIPQTAAETLITFLSGKEAIDAF